MIRLERITLQGFKSFAGKITIPFPKGFNCICGPNGSGKCLGYDSIVTLADSRNIKIGELVEEKIQKSGNLTELDDGFFVSGDGTEILTLNNELKIEKKPVKAFIKKKSPEKMLLIKTRSGREITCTTYHPFFGIKEDGMYSLEARDIKVGKKIAVPRIIKVFGNIIKDDNKAFENLYVPYSDELKGLIKSDIIRRGITQREFAGNSGIPYHALKGLFGGQSIRHDYLKRIVGIYGLKINIDKLKSKNQKKTFSPSSMTPELARFLGYIISEGRSTNSNQVWFVNDDEDLLTDFISICDNSLSLKANVFSYKGSTKDVIVFSKPLQVWLENNFNIGIGSKSAEKTVPHLVMEGSEVIIKNFLSALFEGDGYFHLKKNHAYFEYATASKNLAFGVQYLLLRLGILSIIKEKNKSATNTKMKIKRKYYSVYVYGEFLENLVDNLKLRGKKRLVAGRIKEMKLKRNPNVDLIPNINLIIKTLVKECKINLKKIRKKCPKLAAYYENRCECSREGIKEVVSVIKENGSMTPKAEIITNQLLLLADSDILWDAIVEIKEVEPQEWVYDLTVDTTHNYVANNFFVHNSNIIDALMFVLGTSSARAIRAQRLQNLIFNGARDRKPADFCEVILYLENDGTIPGYEREIKVMRRVNRSGITFYRLNGKTVTRSKILDLLANASLSPEGYNIIMQGDVTKIIEMNPRERRGVIDEISGIAEFDEKKEKAGRELERVELRVRENMIVIAEKQKLVARLKQEKENAQTYKRLYDDLRKSKASLFHRRIKEIEEKLTATEKEDKESDKKLADIDKEFRKIEKELQEKEDLLKKVSEKILQKSRNIEIMRMIDSIQTEIIRKRDKIDLNERQITMLRGSAVERNEAVKEILEKGFSGVHGTFSPLVSIDRKYDIALEVAIGRHDNDIVVDDEEIAAMCIKHLKQKKIGRARFLPLKKLRVYEKKEYKGKEKIIGYLIDFVKYDKKFSPAVEHVLGSTLLAENIDIAKKINGFRIVTLDGDLVEPSGEMIGGFYRKRAGSPQHGEIKKLENENFALGEEIEKIEQELADLKTKEQTESKEVVKLQQNKTTLEKEVDDLRKRWKEIFEEKITLQNTFSKGKIERARLEASYDNLKTESEEFSDIKEYHNKSVDELQERVRTLTLEINKLGPVNLKALEEYDVIIVEFVELKKKLDKLINEKEAVLKVVEEVSKKRYEKFMETFNEINRNFSQIYRDLAGGSGGLRLEEENNIDSGLIVEASPPGKRVLNLDSMSGGEKTLTSLAFLFAIMQHYSSPFYVLDEIDAALDKTNTKKIANLIKKYADKVQFIVITHNDLTISEADKVFGVSIEGGVSKIFGIEMPQEA